jgi:hypothetical protein
MVFREFQNRVDRANLAIWISEWWGHSDSKKEPLTIAYIWSRSAARYPPMVWSPRPSPACSIL